MLSLGRLIIALVIPQLVLVGTLLAPIADSVHDAVSIASIGQAAASASRQDAGELTASLEQAKEAAREQEAREAEEARKAADAAKAAEAAKAEEAARAAEQAAEATQLPQEEPIATETVEWVEAAPQAEYVYYEEITWGEPVAQPKPDASGVYHLGTVQHKIGDSFAHDNDVANEWQENYFVAHSGSAQGQIVSALSKGAKIEVEGMVVTISGSYYGHAGESYEALRDTVGWDKVCFQTCIDLSGNYVVWYGTKEGAAPSAKKPAAPAPVQAAPAEETIVEYYETTTYETITYETTYEIDDLDDLDDFDDFDD